MTIGSTVFFTMVGVMTTPVLDTMTFTILLGGSNICSFSSPYSMTTTTTLGFTFTGQFTCTSNTSGATTSILANGQFEWGSLSNPSSYNGLMYTTTTVGSFFNLATDLALTAECKYTTNGSTSTMTVTTANAWIVF
jgi:hypothetical protein